MLVAGRVLFRLDMWSSKSGYMQVVTEGVFAGAQSAVSACRCCRMRYIEADDTYFMNVCPT